MKVYKAGSISIITLTIRGQTNEKRDGVVDPLHAKFRTQKAYVDVIENVETGWEMISDCSIHNSLFIYTVGKIIEVDNYDTDINEVCAPGIHYFKTREAAESWWLKYWGCGYETGLHRAWHENGQLVEEYTCKDGVFEGLYRRWHEDGKISKEGNYKDGKKEGLHRERYPSGQLESEVNYKDGKVDGTYHTWFCDGTLSEEIEFKDGIYKRKRYYPGGKIFEESITEGKKRQYKMWDKTGDIIHQSDENL
jgi:Family of unknown function (DUF5758)/MORN repeat variant